jgi:hypothetical protein
MSARSERAQALCDLVTGSSWPGSAVSMRVIVMVCTQEHLYRRPTTHERDDDDPTAR